jgi:predicted Zn-dependent protease with MMP-like domain
MALPDKITLYKKAIEAECKESGTQIKKEIRDTICHEIAHHFGIDDDRLHDLDVY